MHLEDLPPALDVGLLYRDLAIEPTRPQQRLVENVRAVSAREDHHVGGGREAVHLHQKLVERVFALVVAAAEAALAALPAHGVDLVDEDDARRVGACLWGL